MSFWPPSQSVFQELVLALLVVIGGLLAWLAGFVYARERKREINLNSRSLPLVPLAQRISTSETSQSAVVPTSFHKMIKKRQLRLSNNRQTDSLLGPRLMRGLEITIVLSALALGGYYGYLWLLPKLPPAPYATVRQRLALAFQRAVHHDPPPTHQPIIAEAAGPERPPSQSPLSRTNHARQASSADVMATSPVPSAAATTDPLNRRTIPPSTLPRDNHVYTDPDHGLSFTYPGDWMMVPDILPAAGTTARGNLVLRPTTDPTIPPAVSVRFTIESIGEQTPSEWMRHRYGSLVVATLRKTTINAHPADQFRLTSTDGSAQRLITIFPAPDGTNLQPHTLVVFSISAQASAADYQKQLHTAQDIVSSFALR